MKLLLSGPLSALVDELDLPETLELGPFEEVTYSEGSFFGDGEQIAEVFTETLNDAISHVVGHPSAGYVFAPRTFSASESEHPDYPGKPFSTVAVIA